MFLENNLFVEENSTIIDTLKEINENTKGIALVVDENRVLIGTITDGDIRRAILAGLPITSSIREVYNKNCRFVLQGTSLEVIERIFENDKLRFIPVVNEAHIVVNYYEANNLGESLDRDNAVLIMAGGLGKRLKPLTDDIPKPMLKIGDKPILQTIIEQFRDKGFKNILLSVNYKSEIIESYFRDGSDFGVRIKYIKEEKRMGTAGSIKLAEENLKKPFFVINGDILTNVDFQAILDYHIENNFIMTIGSRSYEMQVPYGVLNLDENCVTSLEEKPVVSFYVSGGIYVLNPETLPFIPENAHYDITELINNISKEKYKIGSYPIQDYWMDIGHLKDFYKANEDIKKYF